MATKKKSKTIFVYAHWQGMNEPKLMGVLHSNHLRGKEVFSFEYDEFWLKSGPSQLLDPNLQLFAGPLYTPTDKVNFGLFLDSAPDRWGEILMLRREAAMARLEKREKVKLFHSDFLLGVYDGHRMGALRFKLEKEGPFLDNNKELATPPWASLRELEQISLKLEDENKVDDPQYIKWLSMLVAPGASLGGARPKASIVDDAGALWIAKFPSRHDQGDIGAWEMVAYELAIKAGITMAESRMMKFSSPHHTFMTKRFDRTKKGERIHFASALTMLGYNDGEDYKDGASYLELVEFIQQHGAAVKPDLEELWRRIVFSICISNTDDHLRNHGFMLTEKGWQLSPAYDINPIETGSGLKLNISDDDNALDLSLAMEVIDFFRLSEKRAVDIMEQVKQAVCNWRKVATKYHLSKTEQELKADAFEHWMD